MLVAAFGPQSLEGLHLSIPDNKKNLPQFYEQYATINPSDEDSWEEFYKPATYDRPIYAQGHCKRANCPLCKPLEAFEARIRDGSIKQQDLDNFKRMLKLGRELLTS